MGDPAAVLFNSFIFWIFFPILFALYAVFGHRWQNRALPVASYVFYGWWDPRFLALILLSTAGPMESKSVP